MGMYQKLTFSGVIKPEYREDIEKLNIIGNCLSWKDLEHQLFKDFGKNEKASHVPFGLKQFEEDNFYNEFDKETGKWEFTCQTKYFEIHRKFQEMIPECLVSLEEFSYEDDYSYPAIFEHELKDGKIVQK